MTNDNLGILDVLKKDDSHAVIIGMTGSGKTVFSQFLSQQKARMDKRIMYVSAKRESPHFYDKFEYSFGGSPKELRYAITTLFKEEPSTISVELDYMDGMGLMDIITAIQEAGEKALEDEIYFPISLIVDEVSLLVRHKLEASPATMSLGRAAATWRGFNLQLIVMSQRAAMIPQTVLTQANSIILFKFKQADIQSLKKVVGLQVEETHKWLDNNEFHFAEYYGETLTHYSPINMSDIHDQKEK